MRKTEMILLAALLIWTICVSGCSNMDTLSNSSQTVSTQSSVSESSVVSEESSSVISEESKEFTIDVATDYLKKAISEHCPDAVFGEVEIIYPVKEYDDGLMLCELGIKGHGTVTDSYGHQIDQDFNYAATVTNKGYVQPTHHDTGKYHGGREKLPEDWKGYYN